MRTCSLPDCDRKHEARGFCKPHYKAALRREQPPKPKELPRLLTDAEAAWVAGLFEGEGYVGLVVGQYPQVMVKMTDQDVIERLQRTVGCGRIHAAKGRFEHYKDTYCWSKSGREFVAALFQQIAPWLGARRTTKFQEVLNTRLNS